MVRLKRTWNCASSRKIVHHQEVSRKLSSTVVSKQSFARFIYASKYLSMSRDSEPTKSRPCTFEPTKEVPNIFCAGLNYFGMTLNSLGVDRNNFGFGF